MSEHPWIRAVLVLTLTATTSLCAQDTRCPDPVANDVLPYATAGLTHGPLLGGVTDSSVKVWLRTRTPCDFDVLYGERLPLTGESAKVSGKTSKDSDHTAAVILRGLGHIPGATHPFRA